MVSIDKKGKDHHKEYDSHSKSSSEDETSATERDAGSDDTGSSDAGRNEDSEKDIPQTLFSKIGQIISGQAPDSTYKKLEKTYSFMGKIAPILILVFIIFLAGYIRAAPARVPMADQWAADSINNQLRMQITQEVQQQYPNLPPQNMESMVDKELDKFIEDNREMYEMQLEQTSEFFRSQLQDDDGNTYLTGIDPYHWYRLARNIVRRGGPGDDNIDGKEVDRLMLYPLGMTDRARSVDTDTNVYIGAYSYMMLSNFFPDLSLMQTVFYFTVVLAPLAAIPAFFIAKKFGGIVAGSIAAFIVAIHPSFISRTMGGFFDTDVFNIVLPLFIIWFLIEALYANTWKTATLFGVLSLLTTVLFAFSWTGWWFILLIILLALFAYMLWLMALAFKRNKGLTAFFRTKENRKKIAAMTGFTVGSLILASIIAGFDTVVKIFYEYPMSVIRIKDVATYDIWPNVMRTVAELNPSAHSEIVSTFNGPLMFSLAFIGCILTLVVWKKEHTWREVAYLGASIIYYMVVLADPDSWNFFVFAALLALPIIGKAIFNLYYYPYADIKDLRVPYAAIITIWLVSMVFASTRGVRFNIFIVPPFALGFGILMGVLSSKTSDVASRLHGFGRRTTTVFVSVLFIGLFFLSSLDGGMLDTSTETARNYVPHMNDAWFDGLKGIKETAEEDAVIGSWWDFGHWFKAIAERPVFFDGGSQNSKTAHWMGKSLLTEDELLTVGLLRMMSCGRDEAYDALENDSPLNGYESVDMIDDIVRTNRSAAISMMTEAGVSEDVAEKVVDHTHCAPPEVFYITSEDMLGKGGVWGHFGSWDFHKARQYVDVKKMDMGPALEHLTENYSYDDNRATEVYNEIQTTEPDEWIAPWPGYLGQPQQCSHQEDDMHLCRLTIQGSQQLNVMFNSTAGSAKIMASGQQNAPQDATPAAVSHAEDGGFRKNEFDDSQIPYGMTFIESGDSYQIALMDPLQTASMFTRLFFHDGAGTDHFDKVYDERGIPGGRVIIWKVDWESFFDEIGEELEDFDFEEPEEFESDMEVPGAEQQAPQPSQDGASPVQVQQ
ncbi:MAG: STT3 domain-containing protein [Candidatus Woesearchaeota archaeon]